jgi:hypothetical protein
MMARIVWITSLVAFFSAAAAVHASADCTSARGVCSTNCGIEAARVHAGQAVTMFMCLRDCSKEEDKCRADEARQQEQRRQQEARQQEQQRQQEREAMAKRTLQDWNQRGLIPGGRSSRN